MTEMKRGSLIHSPPQSPAVTAPPSRGRYTGGRGWEAAPHKQRSTVGERTSKGTERVFAARRKQSKVDFANLGPPREPSEVDRVGRGGAAE